MNTFKKLTKYATRLLPGWMSAALAAGGTYLTANTEVITTLQNSEFIPPALAGAAAWVFRLLGTSGAAGASDSQVVTQLKDVTAKAKKIHEAAVSYKKRYEDYKERYRTAQREVKGLRDDAERINRAIHKQNKDKISEGYTHTRKSNGQIASRVPPPPVIQSVPPELANDWMPPSLANDWMPLSEDVSEYYKQRYLKVQRELDGLKHQHMGADSKFTKSASENIPSQDPSLIPDIHKPIVLDIDLDETQPIITTLADIKELEVWYRQPREVSQLINAGKLPIGYTNNNPGNLEATEPGVEPWIGEVNPEGDRYAHFSTPVAGIRALVYLLRVSYFQRRNLDTVYAIIDRWAPTTKDEQNNTVEYASFVAEKLNTTMMDKIDLNNDIKLIRFARAITLFENGQYLGILYKNSWYTHAVNHIDISSVDELL